MMLPGCTRFGCAPEIPAAVLRRDGGTDARLEHMAGGRRSQGWLTVSFAGLIVAVFVAEMAMRTPSAGDRLLRTVGFGGDRLLGAEWWRLFTNVLINPGYPMISGYRTPEAHLIGCLVVLLPAGLLLERRLGAVAVAAPMLAVTVALDVWRLAAGFHGFSGGSSGPVFGVLGGAQPVGARRETQRSVSAAVLHGLRSRLG